MHFQYTEGRLCERSRQKKGFNCWCGCDRNKLWESVCLRVTFLGRQKANRFVTQAGLDSGFKDGFVGRNQSFYCLPNRFVGLYIKALRYFMRPSINALLILLINY